MRFDACPTGGAGYRRSYRFHKLGRVLFHHAGAGTVLGGHHQVGGQDSPGRVMDDRPGGVAALVYGEMERGILLIRGIVLASPFGHIFKVVVERIDRSARRIPSRARMD